MRSDLEELFAFQIKACGLPAPQREFRFHPERRWRFDFAWPNKDMVAAEVEGGIWQAGRHNRGAGYLADMEKYNNAALLGWTVYRFDGKMIKDGSAVNWMGKIFLPSGLNKG